MKRIFIFALSLLILTGCAKAKQESNTITLWHWMSDRQDALEALAKTYEEQTGIKVKIDLYAPSDIYSQRIIASAQARVLPDIYGVLDKKETFSSFVRNGFVADLTEDFNANDALWKKNLFKKAVEMNSFAPDNAYGVKSGIYGVPIDMTNIQMLYNKRLLQKAGINEPPTTFDEFIDDIEALNRVGISGFVSGWGELWLIECFATNYAFNIMGEEKVLATYRGDVPYTDPDWLSVLNIFKVLREKKAFYKGLVTKPNKDAEGDFALERTAFAFNGSWAVNVYQGINPDLEYGVMLPPAVNPLRPMSIWGGAGSSFVVNANSANKDKAVAFLKWLTSGDQQAILSEATKNLPSNRRVAGSIPDILSEFARGSEYSTHPSIWPVNEFPLVSEALAKGIQSIIIAEKSPKEVAVEIQSVKERELKRKAARQK